MGWLQESCLEFPNLLKCFKIIVPEKKELYGKVPKPESVFLSQLVKAMRDAAFDLDAIAESMHRKNNPSSAVPNKVDKPAEFMQHLVQLLVDQIASVAPAKQDAAA